MSTIDHDSPRAPGEWAGARTRAQLEARLASGAAVVAGVLSGTSADGIDVALVRFPKTGGAPAPLTFATLPFPEELADRLRAALSGAPCGLREAALLDRDLGRAFGRAARRVADEAGLPIDLVGSHGQTLWHHDGTESSGAATLQLGDGDFVATEARAWVISDFRQRDIAAGGEGAPLSALADGELFPELERPGAILNLGGLGNLTLLARSGRSEDVCAFDTGPAGSLLDGLARRLLDGPLDRGGAVALRGRAHEGLVSELLEHPFFRQPPPKSTGRDTFGELYVDGFVARATAMGCFAPGSAPDDLFATAVDFVAATVGLALERYTAGGFERLILAGGGGKNRALVQALERRSGLAVVSSAALGVDPDAREALVFALLARRAILGQPSTAAGATGARSGEILGKISPPPAS